MSWTTSTGGMGVREMTRVWVATSRWMSCRPSRRLCCDARMSRRRAHGCAIGDIEDAEAFVKAHIKRARIRFADDEFEDILGAGLLILVRLWQLYDPARDGGRAPGKNDSGRQGVASFAGYASYLLPNKIHDAYMRMHPEHRLVTQSDGKRRWVYGVPPTSLDIVGIEEEGHWADDPRTRFVGDFVPARQDGE